MALPASEVYSPIPYEALSADESLKQLRSAGEFILENSNNPKEYKQAILSESVKAIFYRNISETDEHAKDNYVRRVFALIEGVFIDERGLIERGIKAEVCTRHALYDLGFDMHEPTKRDDYSAIDIFADAKGESGPILAIQIKADANLDEPLVVNLSTPNLPLGIKEGSQAEKDAAVAFGRINTRIKSREFLRAHPEFTDKDIIPMMVRVPSGKGGIHGTMSAFKRTGEPALGFTGKLYDRLERSLGWEEY
mgnify:CR=1 FL=1